MFDYSPPQNLLDGKNFVVTGASDGIGKSLAICLAEQGATVILLGRSQDKLERVYDDIESRHPGRVVIQPMDFASAGPEAFEQVRTSLDEQFPVLDGLVHNAGMLGTLTPIQYTPAEQFQNVLQVNVTAAFLLTKALLPALSQATDGRLLFTSSSVGRKGRAYWGAYAAAKFAIEGLMQTLAEELASTTRIRVNSLNPGATRTAMRARAFPAEDPNTLPTAESLLPVYLYLLGPEGRQIHGQALDARSFNPQDWSGTS